MHDYENWLFEFEIGNAREKYDLLLDLPERFDLSAWPHVLSFERQIRGCGRPHVPFWFGDVEPRPKYCNHPLCPMCRRRVANKSKRNGMARLMKAAGGPIKSSDVSAVSINGLPLTDDEDPRATRERMARAIRDAIRDCGLDLRGIGRFEITRTPNRELRLDIHCEIHHPGTARSDVLDLLKDVFPDDRAVQVKEQAVDEEAGAEEDLERSIEGFLGYAAKTCISGDNADNQTVEDVFQIISLYQQIRTQGCKGLTFEVGLRKRKVNASNVASGDMDSEQFQERQDRIYVHRLNRVFAESFDHSIGNEKHLSVTSYNACIYRELVSECSEQLQGRCFTDLQARTPRERSRYPLSISPDPQTHIHHTGNHARAPPASSDV